MIENMNELEKSFPYILKKSRRAKHLRLTINCDAKVIVTLPHRMSEKIAKNFIYLNREWILKKIDYFIQQKNKRIDLSGGIKDYEKYKKLAKKKIEEKLAYYGKLYGFKFNRVTIKNQGSCWGSCSIKKNLNFNYRLVLLPERLLEYIVVHELCHLAELNHGRRFWQLVKNTIGDYKQRRKQLNNYKIK